jgi:3'-phosphoadenosine 5'-phosphosulfate sulfotransferase (PAPS reductase)/FAD synthetase
MKLSHKQLKVRQSLPLVDKLLKTKQILAQFIHSECDGLAYLAFSGGKDSTVLYYILTQELSKYFPDFPHRDLDLVFDIPSVFCDTGVELPEVRDFVQSMSNKDPNIVTIKPTLPFVKVVEKYGYPLISKEQSQFIYEYKTTNSEKLKDIRVNGNKWGRGKISKKWQYLLESDLKIGEKCCNILKKNPSKKYEKETGRSPILATMAEESQLRVQKYLQHGCIITESNRKNATPIAFWTDKDIWDFLELTGFEYCKVYNEPSIDRTGCSGCMFGIKTMKDFKYKFIYLYNKHPKWFNYYWKNCDLKEYYKLQFKSNKHPFTGEPI